MEIYFGNKTYQFNNNILFESDIIDLNETKKKENKKEKINTFNSALNVIQQSEEKAKQFLQELNGTKNSEQNGNQEDINKINQTKTVFATPISLPKL